MTDLLLEELVYPLSKEEMIQIIRALESAQEEMNNLEDCDDFVATVGAEQEIFEALLILESAVLSIEKQEEFYFNDNNDK